MIRMTNVNRFCTAIRHASALSFYASISARVCRDKGTEQQKRGKKKQKKKRMKKQNSGCSSGVNKSFVLEEINYLRPYLTLCEI